MRSEYDRRYHGRRTKDLTAQERKKDSEYKERSKMGEKNTMADIKSEIKKRRTFAIISHPDAGKTTLTEKFLLYGGAINQAGSVKGKATAKHAVSDWMEIEKERGISGNLFRFAV